jgi:hypothetical protein
MESRCAEELPRLLAPWMDAVPVRHPFYVCAKVYLRKAQ